MEHKQPASPRPMPWGELPRPECGIGDTLAGLLVVDKDKGVTSHDIVGAVRRLAGTRKVGHGGTLDPMATGVLCVGIGKATKLLQYVVGEKKEYEATIRFGISTTTEDAEGDVRESRGCMSLAREDIQAAIADLTGEIMQVPSAVSAIKVDGKRAYERVRSGEDVQLAARPVTVSSFEILGDIRTQQVEGVSVVDCDVRVQCSAGTYIRALARDLGDALGCGAHLTALRRTRVGVWGVDNAATIARLAEQVRADKALDVIPLNQLCTALFTVLEVSESEAEALRHGQFIAPRDVSERAVAMCEGEAVALVVPHKGKLKPELVF